MPGLPRCTTSLLGIAGLLLTTACVPPNEQGGSSALAGTLNGAGSSAQEAAFVGWRAAFQTMNPSVTVNYDPTGSGAGRELFLAGGVHFAASDTPLDVAERRQAERVCGGAPAVSVPSYVSAIAVVYQLPGYPGLRLSPATLAQIFAGGITRWNHSAIAADNPGTELPDQRLSAVHRSDDSGTTATFTEYLAEAAPTQWPSRPDGVWPLTGGEAAQGNAGVVDAVRNGIGTIGYADASQRGDLEVAAILVGGRPIQPSARSATAAVAAASLEPRRPPGDLALDLDRGTTQAGVYPLILISYVMACPTPGPGSSAVHTFLRYLLSERGQSDAARTAGSAPLPARVTALATQALIASGTDDDASRA